MAKKLSLSTDPTFVATAQIPVPGAGTAPVKVTYKYRDRAAFKEFLDVLKDSEDAEVIMDIACGWDLDEAFDKANVEKLVAKYIGAPAAILSTYISEQTGARAKN